MQIRAILKFVANTCGYSIGYKSRGILPRGSPEPNHSPEGHNNHTHDKICVNKQKYHTSTCEILLGKVKF